MENIKAKPGYLIRRAVTAVLSPFAVATPYFYFSNLLAFRHHYVIGDHDWAVIIISVLIGAAFVVTLPVRLSHRILCLVVYIPAFPALLYFFRNWFVDHVFYRYLFL